MSNYPKYQIQSAIASQGDYVIPPLTPLEAGTGRLSQQDGWGRENAIPIEQGGIPPHKDDFNGILFLLSQFCLWFQQGGIMNYSALLNYEIGNEVLQNGVKYRCIKENGPTTTTVAPGSNRTYWKNIDVTVPAGAILSFNNVSLGGTNKRNPIFWGTTQPDTGWVLCDGGDDGRGGKTPNLIDKFIKGSTVANIGKTGGNAELNINNIQVNGTIGGTALTVAQLPAHSHTASTNQAGNHAHTRGSMNITGRFHTDDQFAETGNSGCFYGDMTYVSRGADNDNAGASMVFDASRSWSGETSYNGQHQHTVSVSNTGSGQTHTHSLTANTSISGVSNEPPFYCMAFFMKVPE